MDKMAILLKQLELSNVPHLLSSKIKRVIVHHDDHYTFFISSAQLLPLDEVIRLLDSRNHFPYPTEFFFETKQSFDEAEVLEYSAFIFEKLAIRYPEIATVEKKDLSFKNNVLLIQAINVIQVNQFTNLYPVFEHYFQMFGLHISFKTYIDKNNEDYKALEEELNHPADAYVSPEALKMVSSSAPAPSHSFEKGKQRSYKKEYTHVKMCEVDMNIRDAMVQGYCFKEETTQLKSGKHLQTLYVTDYTDSIIVKRFESKRVTKEDLDQLKKGGKWIRVKGQVEYDKFSQEQIIMARDIEIIPSPKEREDQAKEKRVELHMHSNMSTLDGMNPVADYIKQAAKWGHKAVAVTDHGNVQSFPDAQSAAKSNNIKMIYGVELNMIDMDFTSVMNVSSIPLNDLTFVSFDLETTGLSQIDDHITEFGAVKIKNGLIVDRMQSFVKSPKPISPKISELTSITNEDIKHAPTIEELMPKILEFFGDHLLVAHNGKFDIGMLDKDLRNMGQEPIQNTWIDSLPLARHLIPLMRSYRLGAVCNYYKIPYDGEEAHRADYDAEVLGLAFNSMVEDMKKRGIQDVNEINDLPIEESYKHAFPYHMTAIAKTHDGLKNMFRIISLANTKYFYRSERIPRAELEHYRDGLLYGSSCLNSKVFEIAATRNIEELREEIRFYDYIEIQPLVDAECLVYRHRYESLEDIQKIYERIIQVAKEEGKIIVATGDVHFLNPSDKIFRDVFISNDKLQINGRPHPLLVRGDPKALTPDCYFRTTDEMLKLFPYLSDEETYEYVVTNTNKIADLCDDEIQVVKDKLYPPHIENVDQKFKDLCYDTAHRLYGKELPEVVEKRLEREVSSIIKHGFAVIYYISALLVHASNDDGYLVGSRGSVGSSFAATMSGISEVNPLPPHYRCPHCQHSEFFEDGEIANGFDLPDKRCPVCGTYMKGDGHNIPFETFLGFNGDKVPDIDLNFSGEYQPKAHAFCRKIFGEAHSFRAGTIATVAEKTAYGYAKAYAERLGIEDTISGAELQRLADGCQGVKRTTGQHPAGIIVIPDDMEVFDFTPYQYPADDVNAAWKTTHFDFHKIHDNVLKFDILGHVDPTVTRKLQDLTGIDPMTIPTNDPYVMSLFTSSKALGIDLSYMNCKSGAIGLPEFGTRFVRSMLDATQPKSFNDLVIISGLSHGTDVYLGNAETLIKTGTCTLSNVIGCRDDIMVYLIEKGLPNKDAFDIMEVTRKGKAPKVFPDKGYVELMQKNNVPQWYIDSCLKIKYMFPKAHAAAYVYSALRIAWWKLYYPREYYTVYFTTRCDAYEIETMINGKEATWNRYQEILHLKSENKTSNKDEALITVFEVCMEMFDRGYHFSPLSLDKSDSRSFTLDKDDPFAIVPPFTSIDGLGDSVGDTVIAARNEHEFTSVEDVKKRTKLSNTHIETLSRMGVLDHLSESDQLSIFDL
ncbi:MAG: PolC-type DNA polymerase III [Kandleria vitulina]|uniref:PolC-type DNA polymerase III n=1 Tax=Kandleria vitulina TaxID=1630 RepID=UPI002E773EC8|nr:PolC-type DNA polymerase III [Kandleria vitulina]MEE0988454.1 PolC-type DNA polymerase III [Kandleria vitulina]